MSLSDLVGVVAVLATGGVFVVFCGKGIVFFADLRTSVKTLTGIGERLEGKLEDHQRENRGRFQEFDVRVGYLEYKAGVVERRRDSRAMKPSAPSMADLDLEIDE